MLSRRPFLNVALRPIGKCAKAGLGGVWHSREVRRAPFRDVGLVGLAQLAGLSLRFQLTFPQGHLITSAGPFRGNF